MSHLLDDEFADRLRDHLCDVLERQPAQEPVCPREIARGLASELRMEWRELMRPMRHVATELVEGGAIEAVQDGQPVSLREARGPVGLRLKRIGRV